MLAVMLLVAAVLLACASCGSKDSEPPDPGQDKASEDTLDAAVMDKLESATDTAMQGTGSPGCIAGAWTPEGSWTTAKGLADVEAGVPMSESDLIRIGSITKTFTATAVLMLCDEGTLSLDDDLGEFVPAFSGADRVTLRQLLSHTSGIPSWDEDMEIRQQVEASTGEWTVERLIQWAAGQPLAFEPGTSYQYNNLNYNLLGMVIEQVTGKLAGEVIEEMIAVPLGLENTFMPDAAWVDGETVHGYDGDKADPQDVGGLPSTVMLNYDLAGTAGGMISTLEDLRVWARALATGELISEEMHLEQLPKPDPQTPGVPFDTGYGLGLSMMDAWLGHAGSVSGYNCYMFYCPEHDAVMVTFFNKLNAFDVQANADEQWAYGKNFVMMSQALYPDTFPGI
jgi:D-alanyl-D-alanine carboxypeptidase